MTPRTLDDVSTLAMPAPYFAAPLEVPSGSLIVIAGLPGAGKTTLLRRWASNPSIVALDPEDVARRLAPLPMPYRLLRPLVHLLHLLRVVLVLRSAADCVLTTDPMTGPLRRAWFGLAARASGRRLSVVLVHVTPAQACDGQRRRGRMLSQRRMERHERRYRRAFSEEPASVVAMVLSRDAAARAEVAVRGGVAPGWQAAPFEPLIRARKAVRVWVPEQDG